MVWVREPIYAKSWNNLMLNDGSDQFAMTYVSGAIESSEMNRSVLDVLEGTIPAFDNRRDKYFH